MKELLDVLVIAACVLASGSFSGSETALYSLSRARVELEARAGRLGARMVRRLLERDSAVLVTILIGNNVVLELATHRGEHLLAAWGVPSRLSPLAVTLFLTPLVFFGGELLPKDLFRRRPHRLLALTAPLVLVSRFLFWPLERLLTALSAALERALGVEPRGLVRLRGHEALLLLFEEGARGGTLHRHASEFARNVLRLRATDVTRVMVPWSRVRTIPAAASAAQLENATLDAAHSRLPLVGPAGEVLGYVHQLDVVGRAGAPAAERSRPIVFVPPGMSVDRALGRLRATGQRLAVVGSREAPLGLITLKDLVEEISGELAGW